MLNKDISTNTASLSKLEKFSTVWRISILCWNQDSNGMATQVGCTRLEGLTIGVRWFVWNKHRAFPVVASATSMSPFYSRGTRGIDTRPSRVLSRRVPYSELGTVIPNLDSSLITARYQWLTEWLTPAKRYYIPTAFRAKCFTLSATSFPGDRVRQPSPRKFRLQILGIFYHSCKQFMLDEEGDFLIFFFLTITDKLSANITANNFHKHVMIL